MNLEQKQIVHIINVALKKNELNASMFAGMDKEKWTKLYKISARQGVFAISCDVIKNLPAEKQPPRNIMISWILGAEKINERFQDQKTALCNFAAFMNNCNIPVMLLKGLSLAEYYPKPENRECGDVDIYLFGKQKQADKIISGKLGIKIHNDVHHHTTFKYQKIMFENHYDFINITVHASNKKLEQYFKRLADESNEKFKIENVYTPSPNFNALFLMRHMASHFAADAIAMRLVIDWMLFVEKNSLKIDFKFVNEIFENLNMHKFANCINAIAIDHFGMNKNIIPSFERNEKLERRVLMEILQPEFKHSDKCEKGNFFKVVYYKTLRFIHNKWKHKIVYSESVLKTFFRSSYSHLLKPKTIANF